MLQQYILSADRHKLPYLLVWVQYDDEIKTDTTEIWHTAQQQSEENVSSSSMFTMIGKKHLFRTHGIYGIICAKFTLQSY